MLRNWSPARDEHDPKSELIQLILAGERAATLTTTTTATTSTTAASAAAAGKFCVRCVRN